MKALHLLAEFIEKYKDETRHFGRNEWLMGDDMEVYVRLSVPRILGERARKPLRLGGERIKTLDIANISVYNPGQGHFTEFLAGAEKLFPAIYIENVYEPRFALFFEDRGYERTTKSWPTSLYKLTGETNGL